MKHNLEKRNDLMYYEGTDELADGHFEHRNEDGSLFCQYSLKEGKYDGVCTFYWSNGNTAHEAFFEDGGCSGEIFFTTQTVKFKLLNNLKIMSVMVYASNSVRMALLCFYLGTKMVKRYIMRVIPI